jgi:hypothetical protein
MVGGANYQARVAAYVAVHVLAEEATPPPLGLWSAPIAIDCEPSRPVDDLTVQTHLASAHVQAKRSANLSDRLSASFASAIGQFVSHFHESFDPDRDLLVLAVQEASGPLRLALGKVLKRAQTLPEGSPLSDLAKTRSERQALRKILGLLGQLWRQEAGQAPTDGEIRRLLGSTRLAQLHLDDDGAEEREAQRILRTVVLQDAAQGKAAWEILVAECLQLTATRGSADRRAFVRMLEGAGIHLRAPRSFEEDIRRLREHSGRMLVRLERFARTGQGEAPFTVTRPHTDAIRQAAAAGHLLVTGEPGSGKTGCTVAFLQGWLADGHDAVVLSAQETGAASLGLLRGELGLLHDLAVVLRNWPGEGAGILAIDGLDAARGESAQRALTQLTEEVVRDPGRWRVVASIREFDLRYSTDFRRLFQGSPVEGPSAPLPDPALLEVRHLVVGPFSDEELEQVEGASPELGRLLALSFPDLRELLRNPFNLSLAADLLSAGVTPEQVKLFRTQTDLLERYWQARVLTGGTRAADGREYVLRRALEAMVTRSSLQAERGEIVDSPAAGAPLEDLLSSHVLVEWAPASGGPPRRNILAFRHHVLFDYAAARLLLPSDPQRLSGSLEKDSGWVLVLRPSLVLHYYGLWQRDRCGFWDTALAVSGGVGIPEVGKLIGPGVAALLAVATEDLQPLGEALSSPHTARREAADNAFMHLVGSILVEEGEQVGQPLNLWPALLAQLAGRLRSEMVYPFRSLLYRTLQRLDDMSEDQVVLLGAAARGLLSYAWRPEVRDPGLGRVGLAATAKTFRSDPEASRTLLRRAFEQEHLKVRGADELLWLCREVDCLVEEDGDLVHDLYVAAFAHQETSVDLTQMGTPVLALLSTRKQDYGMALHMLVSKFGAFLKIAPELATSAAVQLVEQFFVRERRFGDKTRDERRFSIRDLDARVVQDYSVVWSQDYTDLDEYLVQLLRELEKFLGSRVEAGDLDTFRQVFDVVAEQNRASAVWGMLLRVGAAHPQELGAELLALATAPPILVGVGTSHLVGRSSSPSIRGVSF